MTAFDAQQRRWRDIGYSPPVGPERCGKCGWHGPTQGHISGCPNVRAKKGG